MPPRSCRPVQRFLTSSPRCRCLSCRPCIRLANPAELVADQQLKKILSGITFPIITDKITGPLFGGQLHFVQIKFKVASQGNATISVSDPDMATIVTYAGAVSGMISAYADQYGVASLTVSPAVIPFTVQLATNQYNDGQLQQWVNQISAALPPNSALAIPNPPGIVDTKGRWPVAPSVTTISPTFHT